MNVHASEAYEALVTFITFVALVTILTFLHIGDDWIKPRNEDILIEAARDHEKFFVTH